MSEKIDTKKVEKEENLDELIHRICSETKVGEGVEMFDDWSEIAPHYLDNIVPGEEGKKARFF